MTETRWRGLSHKEIYLLLHDGPGPAASAEPSRRWGEMAAALTEIGEDLHKALDASGAAWAGRAAGAAYDRLSTTADWAARTATSAAEMRASVESQAEHIATARAQMPKPEDVPTAQPDPTVAPVISVIAAQTDLEPPEAAAASGEERAFEVMAAYELNSSTTTAALASFSTPADLVEVTTVHDRGGAMQIPATAAAGLHGPVGAGTDRPGTEHGRGWHSPGTPGAPAPGTSGATPGTSGAAAPASADVARRPLPTPAPPPPAPGNLSGATTDPFLAPTAGRPGGSARRRSAERASAAAPRPGATSLSAQVNDLQAAAAGQAAANSTAQPGAAPFAPTAGTSAGGQDKVALRRFGMDAIGSSQWFGDADEPVVGQTRRRRNFRETEQVTESVSILGEEHKLPPNVIGER